MTQVFTSYSRRDTEVVDSIVARMTQAGITVWIDREAIKAGNQWRVQIVEAIDTCLAFILMLSPSSAASDNVRKEIDLSQESGRTIFALMLDPVRPLPAAIRYQLAGLQFIDVQMLGFDQAVDQLIETVKEHLAKFEPVEPPESRQAELVIQGIDLKALTAEKQEQLLDFLSRLTSADRSQLQIANVTPGSVHVFVDMPARAAYELKTMALNRDPRLKELGIASLRLDGDAKYVNTSLGTFTLAATISPLALLWMNIPALFSSLLGATAGKVLTVALAAVLLAAVGLSAPSALAPLFGSPTPTPLSTRTPTPAPPPTGTATATQLPTSTATFTATPAPTATASQTPTPTLTPLPTFSILNGEIINRTACRHGPGDLYLYRFGLIPGNRIEVSGRMEIWTGRETQTWVYGLPEFFSDPCWVNARDVKLNGELSSLETVYPDKVELPIIRNARWPVPQNVTATRLGDPVSITWDFFDVPLGERESENAPRYLLELWLCQKAEVLFMPVAAWSSAVRVVDEAGCAEPSHGRIFLVEKHGYVGPVEIEWPPYPPQSP